MVSSSSSPPSSSLLPEEPTAFLGRGYSRRYTPIFFSFSFSSIFHSLPLSDHDNRSPPDQSVSGNQLRQFDWNGCQFHPQIIGLKPSSPFGPILWYAPCRQKVKLLRQKWFDPSATIKPSASVERQQTKCSSLGPRTRAVVVVFDFLKRVLKELSLEVMPWPDFIVHTTRNEIGKWEQDEKSPPSWSIRFVWIEPAAIVKI